MNDILHMSKEERFDFGSWLYKVCEGWKEPDWWEKHRELAEATGHVLTVNITTPQMKGVGF